MSQKKPRRDGEKWIFNEVLVAFYLYWLVPSNQIKPGNELIKKFAHLLGRSFGSVKAKLWNIASHDPEVVKKGEVRLKNTGRYEKQIWSMYLDQPENVISAARQNLQRLEFFLKNADSKIESPDPLFEPVKIGENKLSFTSRRTIQSYFRRAVLSAYNQKCAITKLTIPKLLEACHIIPWREDVQNRLDPRNGICLNPLHHKAFDLGLITFNAQHRLMLSPKLKDYCSQSFIQEAFYCFEDIELEAPENFLPTEEMLKYHNDIVFLK